MLGKCFASLPLKFAALTAASNTLLYLSVFSYFLITGCGRPPGQRKVTSFCAFTYFDLTPQGPKGKLHYTNLDLVAKLICELIHLFLTVKTDCQLMDDHVFSYHLEKILSMVLILALSGRAKRKQICPHII